MQHECNTPCSVNATQQACPSCSLVDDVDRSWVVHECLDRCVRGPIFRDVCIGSLDFACVVRNFGEAVQQGQEGSGEVSYTTFHKCSSQAAVACSRATAACSTPSPSPCSRHLMDPPVTVDKQPAFVTKGTARGLAGRWWQAAAGGGGRPLVYHGHRGWFAWAQLNPPHLVPIVPPAPFLIPLIAAMKSGVCGEIGRRERN